MQYTHPGRSGLSVSRLCLGTMNFGPHASEDDSQVIMDRALDLGINFFDTANRYGLREGRGHLGLTEEIIGRWWAQGGGRREKVVLATKLYGAMGDWPNEGKLSALNIRRACEASLRRLQTDHIDIYQMHHVDRETPWGEIWQGMELPEVIRALGDAIYHVHAKDSRLDPHNVRVNGFLDPYSFQDKERRSWIFRTVGYGNGEDFWREFVSALQLAGYDDVLSIEHEDPLIDPEEGFELAVKVLQNVLIRKPASRLWYE